MLASDSEDRAIPICRSGVASPSIVARLLGCPLKPRPPRSTALDKNAVGYGRAQLHIAANEDRPTVYPPREQA
jgi:hypothetical protein